MMIREPILTHDRSWHARPTDATLSCHLVLVPGKARELTLLLRNRPGGLLLTLVSVADREPNVVQCSVRASEEERPGIRDGMGR
jgi:hypothetical protein